MTTETILRVAAKGDGVTETGRHFARAAPGDTVLADGTLEHGPHHAEPACRHYTKCGGCQLQHLDEASLTQFVEDRVFFAANGQEVPVGLKAKAHLSPAYTRRRAVMRAVNGGGQPLIGFNEGGAHKIVGLKECSVLAPELFAVINQLRPVFARRKGKYAFEITLTLTDTGVDCAIKGMTVEGLAQTEELLDFCKDSGLARLTLDQGYGPEAFWEPQPVTVSLSGIPVEYPSASFLQATADGEQALVGAAQEWLSGTTKVVDLFAGLGTFAFGLSKGRKVLAVEAARDAHLACRSAARRAGLLVEAEHRDLFRNPLRVEELNKFDGIVLDPPRAGAREQVIQIAASSVPAVVYISCNPSSWARDAKMLIEAGYRLAELRPVGQFRWSTHVELASFFVKERAE